MKKIVFLLTLALSLSTFISCDEKMEMNVGVSDDGVVEIVLNDEEIIIDGAQATDIKTQDVYLSNDIVYYKSGMDFTYGEGEDKDSHTADEASAHTVVNITKAGVYSLSGSLSKGQIAIDLGDEAEDNPDAKVTLILNGVDITSTVAPAIIFYNVYECGDKDNATMDVDTSLAGANVVIADGSVNNVNGSYVARIYKPESVVLNDSKDEVVDSKKLHKYDGAFYSKMSMNINGGDKGTGVLNIYAENEGLDSELHLTLNGGNVNIFSGNDGINTNEDGVSVTTVNGGVLKIQVTGETGEGDGIDSNGWLVINGGTVIAQACSNSADAGIDSDMGIHINGGEVLATGNMLDRIEEGGQTFAVFNFERKFSLDTFILKNENGESVLETSVENDYSVMIYSSPTLSEGVYTLWFGDAQLSGSAETQNFGRPHMPKPEFDDKQPPADTERPDMEKFDRENMPERPDKPVPDMHNPFWNDPDLAKQKETEFEIKNGSNYFYRINFAYREVYSF